MTALPYTRALESIFGYLGLSELSRLSATCRDWSSAVDSMRPINASCVIQPNWRRPTLQSIYNSHLMRHVSDVRLTSANELDSLCGIIKQSKSLTKMRLVSTCLDDTGASAIASAIKQSHSLTTVDLSSSVVGDIGASAIAEAIAQSKSLTHVNVSFDALCYDGVVALAEAIKQNTSLPSVTLWSNPIGPYVAAAEVIQKQNNSLVAVNV